MNLFEEAIIFATTAHAGVLRRYTNEPYILHPLRVAMRITKLTDDDETRAAAVLHDTMEDVDWVTREVIADNFNSRVAELVYWLTEPEHPTGFNRRERKRLTNIFLGAAPVAAKNIKVEDVLDNVPSIVTHDPAFAPVYLREKTELLPYLEGADPVRLDELRSLLAVLNNGFPLSSVSPRS